MKKFLAIAAIATALVGLARDADAVSFNCGGHLTLTETVICQNQNLGDLDSRMAFTYRQALQDSPGASGKINRSQFGWLSYRNSCGANVSCLTRAYNHRIDVLITYTNL